MDTPLHKKRLGKRLSIYKETDQVIVKTFMPEEYDKIPPSKIWSFLDLIITHKDKSILDTWMKHLEKVKVPYRVTEQTREDIVAKDRCKVLILWCERKA